MAMPSVDGRYVEAFKAIYGNCSVSMGAPDLFAYHRDARGVFKPFTKLTHAFSFIAHCIK